VLLRAGRFPTTAQRRLLLELREIEQRLGNEIVERKAQALDQISRPGFWERPDRFRVLAEAEYLDRFEAACRTASKLGDRLARHLERGGANGDGDGSDAAELCRLLASRVYTLEHALRGIDEQLPYEAFLRLRLVGTQRRSVEEEQEFLASLVKMYLAWAGRRGMQAEVLDRGVDEATLFVSGLGTWTILAPESGLHVLEVLEPGAPAGRPVERVNVSVQLVECEPRERSGQDPLLRQARGALATVEPPAQVVRRYRSAPSALVRDAVRGYRTGRLESVLAGDFDLFVGSA
jgi:ATP-dependent Clp protease ATP-binding subunit ClpC